MVKTQGMQIRGREIKSNDLFFWVEEGQASMGDFNKAKEYVKTAAQLGADGIEFQLAIPEDFYVKGHPAVKHYQKIQFNDNKIVELINYTKEKGIAFIATVLSPQLIPLLKENACDAFVINASDINNPGIIDPVVASGIPFFISLPLATDEEIEWVVNRCISKGADNFALMQGQHTMASGEDGVQAIDTNLGFINTLRKKYNLPIGFIDHSKHKEMPAIAIAAGASFISKHISLNKKEKGPDWFICQEPKEMKETIELARNITISLQKINKVLAPGEHLDKTVMRRSIVALKDLKRGTLVDKSMITFKRPGKGIPPNEFEVLLGKKLKNDIKKDEVFTYEILE